MTFHVLCRPAAASDLTDCAAYIAADNLDAALRFIDAVEDGVSVLAEQPYLGLETRFNQPDLTGLRYWIVKGFNHLLFYRVDQPMESIDIIRILHGARDLPNVLLNRR